MPRKYRLQEIEEDGKVVEVGVLDGEAVPIGRDGDFGIKLPSDAVSTDHGVFLPFGDHWLYKDLDSTNGSWLNEKKIADGDPVLIRPGDVLQLADRVLKVIAEDPTSRESTPRSLLVMARGEPVQEYLIPHSGRAMAIGGSKSDLKLDVDIYELPSLVIEGRGDSIVAYSVSKDLEVKLNGKKLDRSMNVVDRDEVIVEHYRVVINDPPAVVAVEAAPAESTLPRRQEILTQNTRTVVNLPFGRKSSGMTFGDWEEEGSSRSRGFDVHPGMRQAIQSEEPEMLDAVENRILRYLAVGLFVSCVALIVVWLVYK